MTRSVQADAHVDAAPPEVFALLADPRRHAEIDGSGTVRGDVAGPARLRYGSQFSMRMRVIVPYRITNTVVEYAEDRLLAWRHFGGHVWRWELAPEGDGTRVVETFDWSRSISPHALELLGYPARNRRAIEATLRRLQERFAQASK
jgi:hypothetical protein